MYGFDTGFVSFARADGIRRAPRFTDFSGSSWCWSTCTPTSRIAAALLARKAGREVDFVIVRNRDEVDAIECTWDPAEFDPAELKTFRMLETFCT